MGIDGTNGMQISCMAISAALLCDLRPAFALLVVDIPFLVDIYWRFGIDRVLDVPGISRCGYVRQI